MIKLIRLNSNELIIAQVEGETEKTLALKDPFALVQTNDGKLNFIPWSPLSEEDTLVELITKHIVYYATPSKDVVDNYNDIFSNIITPQNAGRIIT